MVTDKDTNTVSLIDVIEGVSVNEPVASGGEPALIAIQAELVSMWTRTDPEKPDSGVVRVRFEDPDKKLLLDTKTFRVDLTSYIRARTSLKLAGIPASRAGIYFFSWSLRRKEALGKLWQEYR